VSGAGKVTKVVTERSFERATVDPTVRPMAIQHPTDERMYRKVHAVHRRAGGGQLGQVEDLTEMLLSTVFMDRG
jgi:hypothetical protein